MNLNMTRMVFDGLTGKVHDLRESNIIVKLGFYFAYTSSCISSSRILLSFSATDRIELCWIQELKEL